MNTTVLLLAPLAIPAFQEDVVSQEDLEAMTREIQKDIVALRKKEFPRPVRVDVSSEKEFLDYVMKRMERDTTPEDQAAEETIAKMLGLIPSEMDYLETTLELLKEQVGGFYDPDTEGFFLMERFGGDLAKIILAHELTHALDDQLYDIDGQLEKMQGNADQQTAFHAVVEGSGTGVMNVWTIRHMSELDPTSLLEAGEMGTEELEQAPPYLWKPLMAVYMKGAAFLNRTSSVMAGQMRLPDLEDFHTAFTAPPLSTEQILHPEKYWDADERDDPVGVAFEIGELPAGWELVLEDTLGELGWGLVVEPLGKRSGMKGQLALLTTKFTYAASEGWGGDRYALFANGGARVLACETVWDTPADAREFAAAMDDELGDHLLQAVVGTARHRGLEAAGRTLTRTPHGVLYLAWMGTDIETAEALHAALDVRVAR